MHQCHSINCSEIKGIMAIIEIKINSLENFITEVSRITLSSSCIDNHDLEAFWFRGHSNKNWQLNANVFREDFTGIEDPYAIEETFIHDFIANYFIHDQKNKILSWETLIQMQHYGVATRLLDWSESALVAFFFAVEKWNTDSEFHPCVWCINPSQLSKASVGIEQLFTSEGKSYNYWLPETLRTEQVLVSKKFDDLKLNIKTIEQLPIALNYTHINSRSFGQKGTCVVIPGPDKELEKNNEILLYKFIFDFKNSIDASFAKKKFLCQLDLLGMNSLTAYPDLQGLSNYLVWKHLGRSSS